MKSLRFYRDIRGRLAVVLQNHRVYPSDVIQPQTAERDSAKIPGLSREVRKSSARAELPLRLGPVYRSPT
jgi:hypothetical protein